MTTARSIINDAYRENNLVAVGVTPNAAEVAEALPRLTNIVRALFGSKLGIFPQDWQVPPTRTSPVNARYPLRPENTKLPSDVWPYPPPNVRLVALQTSPTTVYLPAEPSDGAYISLVPGGADLVTNPLTLDGNGRLVLGAPTLVQDVALTTPRQFMYRADLSNWVEIVELAETTVMPFPEEFDDYFIAALNIRLTPRYSAKVRDETVAVLTSTERKLKQRYTQKMPQGVVPGPGFVQGFGPDRRFDGDLV